MNANDCVWVAVKIFGIYLLVLALRALPALVADTAVLVGQPNRARVSGPTDSAALTDALDRTTKESHVRRVSSLLSSLVRVVAFGLVGVYLLRSGKLLFALIMPPGAEARAAPPAAEPDADEPAAQ